MDLHEVAATQGRLLAAWRGHAGAEPVGQAEAAALSGLARTTLGMWEQGRRGRGVRASDDRRAGVRALEAAVGWEGEPAAGGALLPLWEAVGTPVGLPARSEWAFNFRECGRPCWVWLRSPYDTTADLVWGTALRGCVAVRGGPGGVFVQVPTSIPNPPLEVRLHSIGWADAGAGTVPEAVAAVLKAEVVAAQDVHRPQQARSGRLAARLPTWTVDWLQRAASHFGVRWELVADHAPDVLLGRANEPTRTVDGSDVVPPAWPDAGVVDELGSVRRLMLRPDQAQALREARGFSRHQAAAAANAEPLLNGPAGPSAPISREGIRRLEAGGPVPTADLALARLDTVYAADGRLGVERIFDSGGRWTSLHRSSWVHEIRFPTWWTGPVWLQPLAPDGAGDEVAVRLVWGPWARREDTVSRAVLVTRRAPGNDRPLAVALPPKWRLLAGTGAAPGAVDVGRGWTPTRPAAALEILLDASDAVGLPLPGRNRRGA